MTYSLAERVFRRELTRRVFLQRGCLAALGAGLAACAGPQRLAEVTPVEPTDKVNLNGRYYTLVYGRPSALQIDPIEKEPSFHFWLGATIFCTGF